MASSRNDAASRPRPYARSAFAAILVAGGALAANGCGASIVVIECDDGLELCDQHCVDTHSSEEHCGGCDEPCDGTCVEGVCEVAPVPCRGADCAPTCPEGQQSCGGACLDLQTDARNCGGCDVRCGDGERCEAGACTPSCACGRCDVVALGSSDDVTIDGTTIGTPDLYAGTCSGPGAGDVAHRFIAPRAGYWDFDTAGSSFDTVVGLLVQCAEVSCVDDVAGGTAALASTYLEAGQEVIAIVDGYGGGAGGYRLRVHESSGTCSDGLTACDTACVDTSSDPQHCGGCFNACPPGFGCANYTCQCVGPECGGCEFPLCGGCNFAGDLGSQVPTTFLGSTAGLPDYVQPSCVSGPAPEAMHLFTAPFAATYTFDTLGSAFDTVLTVSALDACLELACNDDFVDLASGITLGLAAGQQVVITVDGLSDSGAYQLNIATPIKAAPPAD